MNDILWSNWKTSSWERNNIEKDNDVEIPKDRPIKKCYHVFCTSQENNNQNPTQIIKHYESVPLGTVFNSTISFNTNIKKSPKLTFSKKQAFD